MKKYILFILLFIPMIVNAGSFSKRIWKTENILDNVSLVTQNDDSKIDLNKIINIEDGFIIEGNFNVNKQYKKVLIKVNKEGNVINNVLLDNQVFNNNYIIKYYKNNVYIFSSSKVMKYDSNLQLIKEKIIDNVFYDDYIIINDNSIYIMKYLFADNGDTGNSYTFVTTKFNHEFEILDTYTHSYKSSSKNKHIIKEVDSNLYYYDEVKNKSLVFDYDKNKYVWIDKTIVNYNEYLDSICNTNCKYGEIDDYYYIEKDNVVKLLDTNYKEILSFNINNSYWKNLLSSNTNYIVYTSNNGDSFIYNIDKDIKESINMIGVSSTIIDNDLYVLSIDDNKLYFNKYDLAFNISLGGVNNGNVSISQLTAFSDELVTINTKSERGFRVYDIKVLDSNNKQVEVNNNTFRMIEDDVVVRVNFTKEELTNPNTDDTNIIGLIIVIISFIILIIFFNNKLKIMS